MWLRLRERSTEDRVARERSAEQNETGWISRKSWVWGRWSNGDVQAVGEEQDWWVKLRHQLFAGTREAVRINHIPGGKQNSKLVSKDTVKSWHKLVCLSIPSSQKVIVEWMKGPRQSSQQVKTRVLRGLWVVTERAQGLAHALSKPAAVTARVALHSRPGSWHCLALQPVWSSVPLSVALSASPSMFFVFTSLSTSSFYLAQVFCFLAIFLS